VGNTGYQPIPGITILQGENHENNARGSNSMIVSVFGEHSLIYTYSEPEGRFQEFVDNLFPDHNWDNVAERFACSLSKRVDKEYRPRRPDRNNYASSACKCIGHFSFISFLLSLHCQSRGRPRPKFMTSNKELRLKHLVLTLQ